MLLLLLLLLLRPGVDVLRAVSISSIIALADH